MKLFYCPECEDVRSLIDRKRYCKCRKSWAALDGKQGVVGGAAIPLGIDDRALGYAIRRRTNRGRGAEFTAYVAPRKSSQWRVAGEGEGDGENV